MNTNEWHEPLNKYINGYQLNYVYKFDELNFKCMIPIPKNYPLSDLFIKNRITHNSWYDADDTTYDFYYDFNDTSFSPHQISDFAYLNIHVHDSDLIIYEFFIRPEQYPKDSTISEKIMAAGLAKLVLCKSIKLITQIKDIFGGITNDSNVIFKEYKTTVKDILDKCDLTQEQVLMGQLAFPEKKIEWNNPEIIVKFRESLASKKLNKSIYNEIIENLHRFPYFCLERNDTFFNLMYDIFKYQLLRNYTCLSGTVAWDYYIFKYIKQKIPHVCDVNKYNISFKEGSEKFIYRHASIIVKESIFKQQLFKCQGKIAIPMDIWWIKDDEYVGHQNLLIIDFNLRECIHIDPHGYTNYPEQVDIILNSMLEDFASRFKLKLITPLDRECPFNLQLLEQKCSPIFKNTLLRKDGLCSLWISILILMYLETEKSIIDIEKELKINCDIYKKILDLNFNINMLIFDDYPELKSRLIIYDSDNEETVKEKETFVTEYIERELRGGLHNVF